MKTENIQYDNIQHEIELLAFALENGLIEPLDVIPSRNALLDLFQITQPSKPAITAFFTAIRCAHS